NRPVPLQDSEVHRIIGVAKTEAPDPKVSVSFELGENVRVVDGPFTDFHGKVVEINAEKGKLKVLVNMFGRETPVELDLLQVERLRYVAITMGKEKIKTVIRLQIPAGKATPAPPVGTALGPHGLNIMEFC